MKNASHEKLKKLVNTSGFPFQVAISNEIERTKNIHGWSVFSSENPWENPETGRSGYVDLILINQYDTQFMIIECKRVRDAKWVFLIPTMEKRQQTHGTFWISSLSHEKRHFGWYDLILNPASPEAEFCVIRGQNKDSKTMLERVTSELVEATESIALEELKFEKPGNLSGFLRIYCSVIITTAQIEICRFDPGDVSIENGELSNAEFETVPLVRFRKSLTTTLPPNVTPSGLGEAVRAKQRTVFVINAPNLAEILKKWEFYGSGPWIHWK